jgi:hypothetical protein
VSGHTSGPWALFEVGDNPKRLCPAKRDDSGAGGESLLTIVEEDGVAFAAVQRVEDANLFVASPDLLAASKCAVSVLIMLEGEVARLGHKAYKVLPMLKAAIEKAEGKS